MNVGETFKVLYDPNDPAGTAVRKKLNTGAIYSTSLGFGLEFFFGSLVFVYYWFCSRNQRMIESSSSNTSYESEDLESADIRVARSAIEVTSIGNGTWRSLR